MPQYKASVTEIEKLAPSVLQLSISFGQAGFRFKPGQWVNFRFPEGVSRAYTIASAPQKPDALQLCIRLGPGKGGEALRKVNVGAEVSVDGPYGYFVLPENDARGAVFLAGDVGIGPIRSIVLDLVSHGNEREIVVLYEPDQRHILYAADFDPLARSGRIVHVSGAIETLVDRHRPAITRSILMAAGFEPFLDRARSAVRRAGVDPETMITESFGPQP